MENIEERCEDNLTDGESTPLLEKPSGVLSPHNSTTPSPSSTASSAPLSTATSTSSSCATSTPTSTASSKAESRSSFAKFNATFGNNNRLTTLDTKSESATDPPSSGNPDSATPTTIITSTAAATTTTTTPIKRMPHLHKLEKKHSSGDLHSRLKTRKLLGVGETDDGDIHRSKLSQILGHSDQLYIRLPYGLRLWQLLMAIMFTVIGLWALILPSHIFHTTLDSTAGDLVTLPIRLYGGALISLALVYWMTLSSQDRDVIRTCLLTSVVYFVVQFLVTSGHMLFSSHAVTRNMLILMLFRALFVCISCFYHWALTQRKFFMKKSSSSKELHKDK